MKFNAIHPTGQSGNHGRWLHELRNVVSTASVAAAMGRRLVRTDVDAAAELLAETEAALLLCRELLATADEHVRDDVDVSMLPATMPGDAIAGGWRTVGEQINRNRERRGAQSRALINLVSAPPPVVQTPAPTVAPTRSGTHG